MTKLLLIMLVAIHDSMIYKNKRGQTIKRSVEQSNTQSNDHKLISQAATIASTVGVHQYDWSHQLDIAIQRGWEQTLRVNISCHLIDLSNHLLCRTFIRLVRASMTLFRRSRWDIGFSPRFHLTNSQSEIQNHLSICVKPSLSINYSQCPI